MRVSHLDKDAIPGTTIAGDSRVLWIVAHSNRPIATRDIADILECQRNNAVGSLHRLHKKGFVTRTDIGRFRQTRYEYELAGPNETCECSQCIGGGDS